MLGAYLTKYTGSLKIDSNLAPDDRTSHFTKAKKSKSFGNPK